MILIDGMSPVLVCWDWFHDPRWWLVLVLMSMRLASWS